MNFTLSKLIVLPLLQTRKRFSEVYPENWISEFIDSGLPVSYSIRFGIRDKKELGEIIEYKLNPNIKDWASYVLLMHLSVWIEKYPEKLEVINEQTEEEKNNEIIGIYNKYLTKRGEYKALIGIDLY